jgi:hypothetical protein
VIQPSNTTAKFAYVRNERQVLLDSVPDH